MDITESIRQKIRKNMHVLSVNFFRVTKDIFERLLPIFGFKLKNYYDKSDFPWLQLLEENGQSITDEYKNNMSRHNIMNVQAINNLLQDFTYDDGWKVVLLKSYDTIIEKNALLYPHTMSVINKIPNVSNAIFSVLAPRKNIQLHRGMYRGIVFIHLGVMVPEPFTNHTFIVNGEKKHWHQGEAFGFEDSLMHEVVNNSDEYRAILLLEVERQDIPFLLKPIHRWILRKIRENNNTKQIIENVTTKR